DTRHARVLDDGTILCEVATTQSRVRIGFAQRTTLTPHDGAAQHAGVTEQAGTAYQASPLQQAGATRRISTTPRIVDDHAGRQAVFLDHMVDVAPGSPVDVDTLTAAVNSRDPALSSVRGGAIQQLDWIEERGFADLLPGHRAALSRLWD